MAVATQSLSKSSSTPFQLIETSRDNLNVEWFEETHRLPDPGQYELTANKPSGGVTQWKHEGSQDKPAASWLDFAKNRAPGPGTHEVDGDNVGKNSYKFGFGTGERKDQNYSIFKMKNDQLPGMGDYTPRSLDTPRSALLRNSSRVEAKFGDEVLKHATIAHGAANLQAPGPKYEPNATGQATSANKRRTTRFLRSDTERQLNMTPRNATPGPGAYQEMVSRRLSRPKGLYNGIRTHRGSRPDINHTQRDPQYKIPIRRSYHISPSKYNLSNNKKFENTRFKRTKAAGFGTSSRFGNRTRSVDIARVRPRKPHTARF